MLLPLNSPYSTYVSIVQSVAYGLDGNALPAAKVTSVSVSGVNPTVGTAISTGNIGYPGDLTHGELSQFTTGGWPGAGGGYGPVSAFTTYQSATMLGAMKAGLYSSGNIAGTLIAYSLPYSASANPTGFTYQTAGYLAEVIAAGASESFFSIGIPADPATLPAAGNAIYSGPSDGSVVDAATGEPSDVMSTFTVTVDFAAHSATISSTGTSSLPANAASGAAFSPDPTLDLTGTLGYLANSNTLTGPVQTSKGPIGNATCRFYGPGIAAATATKVQGAPAEFGCTFAVMKVGGAAMHGVIAAR
jgi:hypothetical protein